MTAQVGRVPDAVAALIQGVLDDHPSADRSALGRLVARELKRAGWQVSAPTGRAAGAVVDGPSNRPPA